MKKCTMTPDEHIIRCINQIIDNLNQFPKSWDIRIDNDKEHHLKSKDGKMRLHWYPSWFRKSKTCKWRISYISSRMDEHTYILTKRFWKPLADASKAWMKNHEDEFLIAHMEELIEHTAGLKIKEEMNIT
jgi:hypothetical protein